MAESQPLRTRYHSGLKGATTCCSHGRFLTAVTVGWLAQRRPSPNVTFFSHEQRITPAKSIYRAQRATPCQDEEVDAQKGVGKRDRARG